MNNQPYTLIYTFNKVFLLLLYIFIHVPYTYIYDSVYHVDWPISPWLDLYVLVSCVLLHQKRIDKSIEIKKPYFRIFYPNLLVYKLNLGHST